MLLQFAGSAAAADYATSETDAVLDQGQQPGPSMRSNDETRQRIMTKFGSLGEAVIRAAAREFNALPESVRNWIDAPDEYGARLGNNENVVLALALRPFARLSPDAARAELERIRSGAAYAGGAPVAVAKARMLSLVIASAQPQAPTAQPTPERRAFGTRGGDPAFPTGRHSGCGCPKKRAGRAEPGPHGPQARVRLESQEAPRGDPAPAGHQYPARGRRTVKHSRHGFICQKCDRHSADTIIVENEKAGEQLCICRPCILSILPVLPAPKRRGGRRCAGVSA